ncbi:outer envelope pore protein 16-2, chloroplastic isoform X2 [Camellia sinensis]|uniref:outer envelope pore protein 16-2, chloroplastic isoform X2 n=1 Tax=Camellia sinensis TaxID=4442 RepID=UPI001036D296|nr:outer envelope pore protein 16-2, chloroplastic isoform X2 [Camellia sinensis]
MSGDLETRTLLDELRSFDKGGLFDLGHPLLNRITESFVKAAGIGAIQAVSREAYFTALEGADSGGLPPEITAGKKQRFPDLRGETNKKSLEALVKNTGKESLQWVSLDISTNSKNSKFLWTFTLSSIERISLSPLMKIARTGCWNVLRCHLWAKGGSWNS